MPDTKKGPWTLQQVRDQILKSCWAYSAVDPGTGGVCTLWVRGVNTYGQLGLSDRNTRCSPVQIPGAWLNTGKSISQSRGVSAAITPTNELYIWGANSGGSLGQSDVIPRSSPVQIPGNTWCTICLPEFIDAYSGAIAAKTDNTIWSWGLNNYGNLGLNDTVPRSSPVQVPGTTWSCISRSEHVLALKNDNTMWTWGRNYNGQLGISLRGSTNHRSSPLQIAGSWCEIATTWPVSLAIKTDSSLWTWGGNHYNGILGLNDTIQRSSPVQVPGSWSKIFAGSTGYTTRAGGIKSSDGCLYMWGSNASGQLGLNDAVGRSSPTVLAGNWSCIMGGGVTTVGKRTDNTIWAWGQNNYGQYNVDQVTYSSPIQVPGSWVAAAGQGTTLLYVC